MKKLIDIPNATIVKLKQIAFEQDTSVKKVIEQAVTTYAELKTSKIFKGQKKQPKT